MMDQAEREFRESEQAAAIVHLERALRRCASVGIALFGMDDNLLALPASVLDGDQDHELFRTHGRDVSHGGAYVGSGGA